MNKLITITEGVEVHMKKFFEFLLAFLVTFLANLASQYFITLFF